MIYRGYAIVTAVIPQERLRRTWRAAYRISDFLVSESLTLIAGAVMGGFKTRSKAEAAALKIACRWVDDRLSAA